MNILLLTGLFEELRVFQGEHPMAYEKDLRAFRSEWYPRFYAATTGPGLSKRKAIRKLLASIRPAVIVNAGLVGILRDRDPALLGERLRIGAVKSEADSIVYPGGAGHDVLVTVRAPVFHPADKAELAVEHGARACDMEAGALLALVAGRPAGQRPDLRVVFCKVVGDLPGDYELFVNEHLTRGLEGKGLWGRLWTALTFPGGPRVYRRLTLYRRTALGALAREIHRTLKPILDSGGRADTGDSVFRPE